MKGRENMMEDTTAEIEQELDTGILPRETVEVNDHDRGELKKLDPPSVALYQEYCDAQQNALDSRHKDLTFQFRDFNFPRYPRINHTCAGQSR